jgi:hypothetical protein
LHRIDSQIARLERIARAAPRPYRFVLLSDHGQTQGATFRQRYGRTLGDVVVALMQIPREEVDEHSEEADTWGYLNAFLTETSRDDGTTSADLTRRATRGHAVDGLVQLGPQEESQSAAPVTALASGNLGLIYFNRLSGRATYEQIMEAYPHVIRGLVDHPGIGFVMVRSEAHGPVAIGGKGVLSLRTGELEGENPLQNFGARACQHLLRLDGFNNVPDVLVNSFYDPVTDEAAAFEELVGGHGGLGGKQMQPFLMYPAELALDETMPIVGAEQLHTILKGWVPAPVMAPDGRARP